MPTEEQVKAYLERQARPGSGPGDQSVYVYLGSVMLDHYPAMTRWELPPVLDPQTGANMGPACEVYVYSQVQSRWVLAKRYEPGGYTFVGRGHPGEGGQGI